GRTSTTSRRRLAVMIPRLWGRSSSRVWRWSDSRVEDSRPRLSGQPGAAVLHELTKARGIELLVSTQFIRKSPQPFLAPRFRHNDRPPRGRPTGISPHIILT